MAPQLVAVLVMFAAGTSEAREPFGEVASYVITFDSGGDADAALVEIERTLPVVITHRFGSIIEGAAVRTAAPPEAMLMVEGVATVDRNVAIELPEPEPEDTATADAQDTTDVFVVHGLNLDGQSAQADGGTNVTVCAGDTALIQDFEFGQIIGPVALPSGSAVPISVYLGAEVDCADPGEHDPADRHRRSPPPAQPSRSSRPPQAAPWRSPRSS